MKTWGGDGWLLVWKLERAGAVPWRKGHSLQSPWLQFPGQAPTLLPLPRTFTRYPHWLLRNLAKELTQITLLQAQPQNLGLVPALELQGLD